MKEYNINDLINCFKMSVDMQSVKKIEEYISNLEQENEKLKKQFEELETIVNYEYDFYSEIDEVIKDIENILKGCRR